METTIEVWALGGPDETATVIGQVDADDDVALRILDGPTETLVRRHADGTWHASTATVGV